MMTWVERKRACGQRDSKYSHNLGVDILSKESVREMFEEAEKCSERRFGRLQDRSAAVNAFREATDRFSTENKLVATIASGTSSVSFPLRETCFKYSHFDDGVLQSALEGLEKGARFVVSLVHEGERMIAYAIAKCPSGVGRDNEVTILDVDRYSRRETGLAAAVTVQGDTFQVGVSHVVLKRLLDELAGPVVTDATNEQSRYVFKSLGFVSHRAGGLNLRYTPQN